MANRDRARLAALLGVVGAVLFAVFIARLYDVLRTQSAFHPWLAGSSLVGGILVSGVALIEDGLAYSASEVTPATGSATRLFILWSWSSASIYAPGFAVLIVGGTAAQRAGSVFPKWFRPLSWTLPGVTALLVLVMRAPGLGAAPGVLWVCVSAILIIFRPTTGPLSNK